MRKKLLIYWTSRTFVEVFVPVIPGLAENFRVVVVLFNYSSPPGLMERLNKMKKQGYIENYILTPEHNKSLKFHLFWRSKIKELSSYGFDYLLSGGEMQVGERYLIDCVLSKKCIVVCMWVNVTHLSINTQGKSNGGSGVNAWFSKLISILKRGEIFERVKSTFRTLLMILRKKIRFCFERFILPWWMVGRVFHLAPFDQLTQFSSGRADALIFFNEYDADAHRKLLKGQKVYVAESLNKGNCRCNKISSRERIVLSPMSGFIGSNHIGEKLMQLFYRDYKTVMSQTGARKLHLRLHPDETGQWSYRLQEYLVDRGIDASIVGCDKPIREIICDYLGFAGFSSSSFKDARSACDYAFVVGFTAVSNYIFYDPKFNYDGSEGVKWIEKDGSFDPDIFVRKRNILPNRKTVPELLMEIQKSN